jgi:ParB family transcriptional regulator, chromosome partitioning protein
MAARKGPLRAHKITQLRVSQLGHGRFQPRRAIDGIALQRLAESIKSEGVLQPLFVRKVAFGRFEIIAGERRWLAAKLAGLTRVPALIGNVSDGTALLIGLVENLHREDLNPIDQAFAVRYLVEEFSMTHEEIADAVGRSRVSVTNLLRLLELPAAVKTMVAEGTLDIGHAKALLSLPEDQQLLAAQHVAAENLSVRKVERMVREWPLDRTPIQAPPSKRSGSAQLDSPVRLHARLKQQLGRGVGVQRHRSGHWRLNVTFSDLQELHRTLKAIDDLVEESLQQPEAEQPAR